MRSQSAHLKGRLWQNYPDNKPEVVSDVIHVYRVIDEVLKKWPT